MNAIYKWFGGTSRFFALFFFAIGVILAFIGKLTANYVAMAGALQTLIVAHSAKEDYHLRNMPKEDPIAGKP